MGIIGKKLKRIKKQMEKRKAIEGIPMFKKYCDELLDEGKITPEKYVNLMATIIDASVQS